MSMKVWTEQIKLLQPLFQPRASNRGKQTRAQPNFNGVSRTTILRSVAIVFFVMSMYYL